jgi:signal transduction histidine kinase
MSSSGSTSSVAERLGRAAASLRQWWPDVLLGAVVLLFGVATINVWDPPNDGSKDSVAAAAVVASGMGVASGLFRAAPGPALGLVWLTSMFHVLNRLDVAPVQLAVVIVAYGAARYGSAVTLWASGLSIPFGAVAGLGYLGLVPTEGMASPLVRVLPAGGGHHPMTVLIGLATGFVFAVALLGMPWTLGLALRLRGRVERSTQQRRAAEAERRQAEEIASLREEQTRLARDVHDVVGHSLAVILAQAESAQFRPDSDTAAVRATLANIAVSARQSLGEVRQVLSTTADAQPVTVVPAGSLDALIEGVQAAGHEVLSTVGGPPQSLPPELEVVAFRVLQEMLTNALKHGRRGHPVHVERDWEAGLRIEVRNVVADRAGVATPGSAPDPPSRRSGPAGRGLDGMRHRLEPVGGRLDVRRRADPEGGTVFIATALVPFQSEFD